MNVADPCAPSGASPHRGRGLPGARALDLADRLAHGATVPSWKPIGSLMEAFRGSRKPQPPGSDQPQPAQRHKNARTACTYPQTTRSRPLPRVDGKEGVSGSSPELGQEKLCIYRASSVSDLRHKVAQCARYGSFWHRHVSKTCHEVSAPSNLTCLAGAPQASPGR